MQTQPHSLRLGREKQCEKVLFKLAVDARPIVDDGDFDEAVLFLGEFVAEVFLGHARGKCFEAGGDLRHLAQAAQRLDQAVHRDDMAHAMLEARTYIVYILATQIGQSLENAKLFDDIQNIKNYNEGVLQSMSNGVITLNEEAHIEACLASVAWADERIVVDCGSTDRTVALAEAAGGNEDRAMRQHFRGDYRTGRGSHMLGPSPVSRSTR